MSISELRESAHASGLTAATARPPFRRLALLLFILMAGTLLLLAGFAYYSAVRTDAQHVAGERALARSALRNELKDLGVLVRDYSWWDAAVINLAGDLDPGWADDNIGRYMSETHRVSIAVAFGRDGVERIAFKDGKSIDLGRALPADLAGRLFEDANAAPMSAPVSVTCFENIGGEIYAIAASALTWESPEDDQLDRRPRGVLVVARALSGPFLMDMAERYLLEEAQILPAGAAVEAPSVSVAIRDMDGKALGHLVWHHHNVAQSFGNDILLMLLVSVIGFVIVGIAMAVYLLRARRMTAAMVVALEEERNLSDLRSHVVSSVAHDLKTPLATIQSAVDLLRHFGGRMDDAEREAELAMIQDRIGQMDRTISDSLELERSDAADLRLALADPADLVRELWRISGADEGRRLDLIDERNVPGPEMIDRSLFSQIVGNLLTNAVKYGHPETPVEVRLSAGQGTLSVSVRDQGIGVSGQDADRIRAAFTRGGNVGDRPGVGLGLAIAERAAVRHGGGITIESEEGQWTLAVAHVSTAAATGGTSAT